MLGSCRLGYVKGLSSTRILVASLLVVASGLSTRGARADVPPPDGTGSVGYDFVVTGLTGAKDDAFFAYPCSGSSGVPVLEYQVVEEGKRVSGLLRGGSCEVYRVPKAKLDAFAAKYKESPRDKRDAELEAFVKGARKCKGAPGLSVTRETYALELKGASCTLTPTPTPTPTPAAPSSSAAPTVSVPATAPVTPEPKAAATQPAAASKGCAASPIDSLAPFVSWSVLGLGAALGLTARMRRRRADSAEK